MQVPEIERRRRAVTHEDLAAINTRLDNGSRRMELIEKSLERNTEITEQVRELLAIGTSGLKVLGWLGTGAKWLGSLSAAGVAIYGFIYAITHNGNLPGK